MKRRLIKFTVLSGIALLGTQGFCRERVRRPVTSFLDFYSASKHSRIPPSFAEQMMLGLVIAVQEAVSPTSDQDVSRQVRNK